MNYWIETYTGKVFDYENIENNEVDIKDIAHALSNICRFNGHSSQFYSVAEHSVLVSREIWQKYGDDLLALKALLHDATETYMPDVPRPLKVFWSTKMDLRAFEDKMEDQIFSCLGLTINQEEKAKIKMYDSALLRAERKTFFAKKVLWRFPEGIPYVEPQILGLKPNAAESLFLTEYERLWGKLIKSTK